MSASRGSGSGTSDFAAAVKTIIDQDKKNNERRERRTGTPPVGESVDMADTRPGRSVAGAQAALMTYLPAPPMLGTIYRDANSVINRVVVPEQSRVAGWRIVPDATGPQTGKLPVDLGTGTFNGWGNYAQYGVDPGPEE